MAAEITLTLYSSSGEILLVKQSQGVFNEDLPLEQGKEYTILINAISGNEKTYLRQRFKVTG